MMAGADHQVVGEIGLPRGNPAVQGEAGFDDPVVIEAAQKDFFDYRQRRNVTSRLPNLEARLVGWGARENEPNSISDIWIDPACQGRGIGSPGPLFR
ncbi:N-acetyltransferase [Rhizobium favelukesii]|nr:N-acetyltransferase [Rhizobium favelukesii]